MAKIDFQNFTIPVGISKKESKQVTLVKPLQIWFTLVPWE